MKKVKKAALVICALLVGIFIYCFIFTSYQLTKEKTQTCDAGVVAQVPPSTGGTFGPIALLAEKLARTVFVEKSVVCSNATTPEQK